MVWYSQTCQLLRIFVGNWKENLKGLFTSLLYPLFLSRPDYDLVFTYEFDDTLVDSSLWWSTVANVDSKKEEKDTIGSLSLT